MTNRTAFLTAAASAALGGVATATVLVPAADSDPAPAAATVVRTAKPVVEVRTRTIHRTVRVVKHDKPKPQPVSRPAVAAAPPRVAPVAAAPAVAPRPVVQRAPVRLQTHSSGTGSGSGEHEREHEGGEREHEGGDD